MANRTVLFASVLVLCLLACDTVQGRVLLQKSKKSDTGLSTDSVNGASAFVAKAMVDDVADPNNGNGVVTAAKAKPAYVAPQGKPQDVSKTTYRGSGGASTSAQATTAETINKAATPGSTTAPPKTTAGIASKVIPQTTFKAAPAAAENGGLTSLAQQASADIHKDGEAIAAKAGKP